MAEAREFTDRQGRRWQVSYTDGGVRGMLTMNNIVFKALDSDVERGQRFLAVHPGYLENVDDHMLEVALSQAQTLDPPS